jgi:hypothetical protein
MLSSPVGALTQFVDFSLENLLNFGRSGLLGWYEFVVGDGNPGFAQGARKGAEC